MEADPNWGTSESLNVTAYESQVNWLLEQLMPPSSPSGPDFPASPPKLHPLQPLWETVGGCFKKLQIAIPLLGIDPKKTKTLI